MNKSAERAQKLPRLRAGRRQRRRLRATDGFTLIELMVVVVILGILATIGANLLGVREKAFFAVMKADLRNLAAVQAPYQIDNYTYANAASDIPFSPSEDITLTLVGENQGFSARTKHAGLLRGRCAIYVGTVSVIFGPATQPGTVMCDNFYDPNPNSESCNNGIDEDTGLPC